MDIKSLKDKILQLAIQGKLVPQNENDEPASVLLKKIKIEKEQLIKEKIIKKEKSLPEITEEEKLFELPKGWVWSRLGEVGIYKKGPFGSTITKSMFVPKGEETIKVYEQKNAIQKDWKLGEYYVTKEYFESKLKGFEVLTGDIIVSCAGTIGETYIMPKEIERGVINQALMKMKILDGINIDYFLMYFDFILKQTAKESSKGSAIKNIPPFDIFKMMLLPIPPIKEQNSIVDKVYEIFKLIDELDNNKQDLLENISNSRNKVLQLAIQGKLLEQCEDDEPASILLEKIREEKEKLIKDKIIKKEKSLPEVTEEEELFDIPKTWEWSRLGNIANIVMGQSPDSSSVSENIGGVEFHQGKASFGKVLIKNSGLYCTKPTKLAISDDVLLSVRAPVGTLNITDRELCIGRGLTAIRRYIDIDNKFFYYFIMALEEELVKKATGTTFKAVASTAIKEFLVPLPPLEEQKRIVDKIDLIMDYFDKLQQEIESQEIILEDILK